MALTITEKQHWKHRIESKLNQRISQLKASDSDLMAKIRDEAQREVYASRKLDDDFDRLSGIELDLEKLKEAQETLLAEMHRKVFGEDSDHHVSQSRIEIGIRELQEEKAGELLLNHDLGRRISRLQEERESLVDSVLLAVDIRQVIDLWDKVTFLVTDQPAVPEQESLFAA